MAEAWRRFALLALVLALALLGATARAQSGPPTATATATAKATATATAAASATPSGTASATTAASTTAASSASGASSASVSAPAASSDPSAVVDPHANPHGAPPEEDPHGQQQVRRELPQDGAIADAELPTGTLHIGIRDAFEAPVPDLDFEILIVRSTVAQGESRETLKATTDNEGEVVITDLKYGSAFTYTIKANYKGASFSLGDIRLDDRSGSIALLHVFEPTESFDTARTYGIAEISVGYKEDILIVTYKIRYENPGPYALVIDRGIRFPEGHKALETPDKMLPSVTATPEGAVMRGTMRPGRHFIAFSFHVPVELDGDQSLLLHSFPNIVGTGVRVTASKKMGIEVTGFPSPKRRYDGEASWLETMKENRSLEDPFIDEFEVKITGLPTRPWGAYFAAVLAAFAVAVGGAYVWIRRKRPAVAKDSYEDLVEAQQALLEEFVALERARQRQEIGPKTYARVRQAMLDALARIMERLEKVVPDAQKVRSGPKKSR